MTDARQAVQGAGRGIASLIYYFGVATLIAHEIDAVRNEEWRLLFILGDLPGPTAYAVFVVAHVPLFAIVLWLSQHASAALREGTRLAVALFLVVHMVLHVALSGRPEYLFESSLSQLLIYAGAVFGFVYLVIRVRRR